MVASTATINGAMDDQATLTTDAHMARSPGDGANDGGSEVDPPASKEDPGKNEATKAVLPHHPQVNVKIGDRSDDEIAVKLSTPAEAATEDDAKLATPSSSVKVEPDGDYNENMESRENGNDGSATAAVIIAQAAGTEEEAERFDGAHPASHESIDTENTHSEDKDPSAKPGARWSVKISSDNSSKAVALKYRPLPFDNSENSDEPNPVSAEKPNQFGASGEAATPPCEAAVSMDVDSTEDEKFAAPEEMGIAGVSGTQGGVSAGSEKGNRDFSTEDNPDCKPASNAVPPPPPHMMYPYGPPPPYHHTYPYPHAGVGAPAGPGQPPPPPGMMPYYGYPAPHVGYGTHNPEDPAMPPPPPYYPYGYHLTGYYPPPDHSAGLSPDSAPQVAATAPAMPHDTWQPPPVAPGADSSPRATETEGTNADAPGPATSSSTVPPVRNFVRSSSDRSEAVVQAREKKNKKARARTRRWRDTVAEIEAKPVEARTEQEKALLASTMNKATRKNIRSRERAMEQREQVQAILNKPESERSEPEKKFLEVQWTRKMRKNEGDRLRRERIKQLGLDRSTGSRKMPAGIKVPARGPLPPEAANLIVNAGKNGKSASYGRGSRKKASDENVYYNHQHPAYPPPSYMPPPPAAWDPYHHHAAPYYPPPNMPSLEVAAKEHETGEKSVKEENGTKELTPQKFTEMESV